MTATESQKSDEPSIGELVKEASTQFSTVLHGEIELAKIELKSTVRNLGTGVVSFVIAATIGLFSLVFLFIALAELFAWAGLFRWEAYLLTFGVMLVLAGLVAFLGLKKVKKIKAPERTIETTKATVAALRHPSQSA